MYQQSPSSYHCTQQGDIAMRKFWQWNINNTPAYWFAKGQYGKGLKIWVKGILIVYGTLALIGYAMTLADKAKKKTENTTARRLINDAFSNYRHDHSKEGI